MVRIDDSELIPGLKILTPDVFRDHRGQYVETFNRRDYRLEDSQGQPLDFVEDDVSRSKAGVLRGLHGDDRTWKLVQCLWGSIVLAVVDMRSDSPAYRRWQTFELDDENRQQVLIPAGCANGHAAISDCLFGYKQSAYHRGAEHQFTVRWNDPAIGIDWPLEPAALDQLVLSERDANAPLLPASNP